jgi:type I restriction enzyme, S subunit
LRAKRRESLAQLDTLLQSTFLDMFGDPVTNPKGWDEVPLLSIAELENGDRSSNYPSGPDVIEQGVLFLSTKNIVDYHLALDECQFISQEKFDSLSRGKLRRNDIVITLRGTLGSCAVFDCQYETGFINAQLLIIRPHGVDTQFLHGLLRSQPMRSYFARTATGVAVKQLTGKQIGALAIPVPPNDLQHRFAAIVESIKQQKARYLAYRVELDTLFAALQDLAFHGELL